MKTIQLPRHMANQLLEQAMNAPDAEICGLIGSRDHLSSTCYPIRNVATHTDRQFRLDPGQQIDAMRQMRERGENLFAIYHSHPSSPPIPSSADIAQASYPGVLYLIISTNTTGTLQLRAFFLENGAVEDANVAITDA